MSREEAPQGSKVYTLRVELEGSAPLIWRRFKVIDQITLATLHETLQVVMGWEFDHLNAFKIGRKEYGVILDDAIFRENMNDESEFELRDLVKRKGKRFKYLYDFGDDWLHEIRVEDIADPEPGVRYPVCVAGERNCPPEDCGGIYGYYDMLDTIKDPQHEQYESVIEWLGDEFDPDAFDPDKINTSLDRMPAWTDDEEWDEEEGDDSDDGAIGRDYKEPVSGLLTLGKPDFNTWRDYAALGIGAEHIPDLIAMATDDALHEAVSESIVVWAPVHAWRALGQLRAEEAITPLIGMFHLIDEDDYWASEDLPRSLAAIGPAALSALDSCLRDEARGIWIRAAASSAIGGIGQRYPVTVHSILWG